ncbi:hypothetical protein E2C01_035415 [Portunus trituberculatus]|uniref:Uncharacterized protein n=1 Tax=Portunus trituberculatus TaxID=210409 RepID=A0A5B7F349_PORTR|nr:hypothetical protein [Portunus trituberculatus]
MGRAGRTPGHPWSSCFTSSDIRPARVLLDIRVGLEVGPQVAAVREATVTLRALEGLLPRVGPDVSLQQPGPRESLATELTLAGQRVRADVHLEGSKARVHLLAVLACERPPGVLEAVELSVLGKPSHGGVAAAAVWTSEALPAPLLLCLGAALAAAGSCLARRRHGPPSGACRRGCGVVAGGGRSLGSLEGRRQPIYAQGQVGMVVPRTDADAAFPQHMTQWVPGRGWGVGTGPVAACSRHPRHLQNTRGQHLLWAPRTGVHSSSTCQQDAREGLYLTFGGVKHVVEERQGPLLGRSRYLFLPGGCHGGQRDDEGRAAGMSGAPRRD